jgi:hypothetical protein
MQTTTIRESSVCRIIGGMTKLFGACLVLTAFIFGAIPALAILVNEPAATATPLWAQEPPQPPQLSDEEQQAWDNKNAGRDYDKDAFKRAKTKLDTAEKYRGDRNQQKQRGGPRRR